MPVAILTYLTFVSILNQVNFLPVSAVVRDSEFDFVDTFVEPFVHPYHDGQCYSTKTAQTKSSSPPTLALASTRTDLPLDFSIEPTSAYIESTSLSGRAADTPHSILDGDYKQRPMALWTMQAAQKTFCAALRYVPNALEYGDRSFVRTPRKIFPKFQTRPICQLESSFSMAAIMGL